MPVPTTENSSEPSPKARSVIRVVSGQSRDSRRLIPLGRRFRRTGADSFIRSAKRRNDERFDGHINSNVVVKRAVQFARRFACENEKGHCVGLCRDDRPTNHSDAFS